VCSSDLVNFLALNIADEIIRGRRDVRGAIAFYRRTLDLAAAGKTSPYMTRLLFRTQGHP
jgi:hypothetical protein